MKTRTRLGAWMAGVAGIMIASGVGRAWAAPYTWNSTSDGNWDDGTATGWNTGGAYPNAQDDTATFSQNITNNQTVTINVADARVGTLTLADTTAGNSWVITNSGANTLTFDVAAGLATINAIGPSVLPYNLNPHTISAPIAAGVPLTLNLGTNGGLALSGNNAGLTGGITVNGIGAQQAYVLLDSAASLGASGNTITVSPGAQAAIAFSGLTQADLNRFAGSSGLLSFWTLYNANGAEWGTPCSPAPNLDLTGFNEYFRIGAGGTHLLGGSTTISGTFTPPSGTFRFGGGGGRLTVNSVLADGASARAVEMSGTEILYGTVTLVALTQANTYTGPTTVRKGALRLAGTGGSALNTSAFNVRSTSALDVLPNAFLQLDAGLAHSGWENETGAVVGNNNNRVADTTPVNLYSGTMHFFGNPDTGTTETIGPLNAQSGLASLDARWKTGSIIYGYRSVLMNRGGAGAGGTGAAVLTAQSLNLNNGAQLMLRGVDLGVAGLSATRVMFATPPTMVGGGGGAGSTTNSILPGVWQAGQLAYFHPYTPGQNEWVTYDASVGLRALSSNEYATLSVGENSDNNARYDLTGASPTLDISSATTVNSLKLLNNTSSNLTTISGAGPLTLKSGNLLVEHPDEFNGLTMSVPLDFNGNAGQVVWFPITHQINYLDSPMSNTGGKGVSLSGFHVLYVDRMEDIRIRGNNTYTGPTAINFGNWRISGSSERIPDASDLAVRSSARLTVDSGLTETVASLSGAGTLALGNTSSRMILGSGAGLAGAVTLEGAGAYIAPGDMGVGTLTLSGLNAADGLRLRSGELRIDLMHAQDYDVLAVGSTKVTISDVGNGYAGSTLVLNLGNAPSVGDTFKILDVAGATPIVGKFSNGDTVNGAAADGSQYGFDILYNSALGGGDGNDVVLRSTGKTRQGLLLLIR